MPHNFFQNITGIIYATTRTYYSLCLKQIHLGKTHGIGNFLLATYILGNTVHTCNFAQHPFDARVITVKQGIGSRRSIVGIFIINISGVMFGLIGHRNDTQHDLCAGQAFNLENIA